MNTKSLIVVWYKGEYKVAQYCQYVGYPSGQGLAVLLFLTDNNLDIFREKLDQVQFISMKRWNKLWAEFGADNKSEFVSRRNFQRFYKKYPHFHEAIGSGILKLIQQGKAEELICDIDFAKDSVMCEWCYLVNLDVNTFEIYKGSNMTPLTYQDHFYFLQEKGKSLFPLKILKTYQLDNLPSPEKFKAEFKGYSL